MIKLTCKKPPKILPNSISLKNSKWVLLAQDRGRHNSINLMLLDYLDKTLFKICLLETRVLISPKKTYIRTIPTLILQLVTLWWTWHLSPKWVTNAFLAILSHNSTINTILTSMLILRVLKVAAELTKIKKPRGRSTIWTCHKTEKASLVGNWRKDLKILHPKTMVQSLD
jgi:hypothetical protein